MGTQVIRKVRNKEYLYYVYYDNRERKEVYCGLVSEPKSKERAQDIEIKELQAQRKRISLKLQELRSK